MTTIGSLVDATNQAIARHNQKVKNLVQERSTLKAQVWKYIIDVDLKAALADYDTKKTVLDKAITGISRGIEAAQNKNKTNRAELRTLEKTITSIKPTVDAVNGLLKSFGFYSFSLALADNGTHYKLVRANGEEARLTLSEGEKTFITFLYFYHLLKGSEAESGVKTDRVVVFDDPVCSLDSDILFIVSTLIRGVIEDVRNKVGEVKQVFVLTHNVYFHKEVTFNRRRNNGKLSEETFWVIRKSDLFSQVKKHEGNPIKTSYELLWSEVKSRDRSKLTIQNTLRRILEHYFKNFGGMELDDLYSYLEDRDKLIYRSLLSWTNDGSHFANDDLYQTVDDAMVTGYLRVFRTIFENSNHSAHYKMMMGENYVEPDAVKRAGA